MTKATAAAGVTGLAGLFGVFLVGRATAPSQTFPTTAVASGVIQPGACLPPMGASKPDPCFGAVGTIGTAFANFGKSSYWRSWAKSWPEEIVRLRLYAASGGIDTPAMTTSFGMGLAELVQAARYAHASTVELPLSP